MNSSILAYQSAHTVIDDMRARADRERQARLSAPRSLKRERVALHGVARGLRLA